MCKMSFQNMSKITNKNMYFFKAMFANARLSTMRLVRIDAPPYGPTAPVIPSAAAAARLLQDADAT